MTMSLFRHLTFFCIFCFGRCNEEKVNKPKKFTEGARVIGIKILTDTGIFISTSMRKNSFLQKNLKDEFQDICWNSLIFLCCMLYERNTTSKRCT